VPAGRCILLAAAMCTLLCTGARAASTEAPGPKDLITVTRAFNSYDSTQWPDFVAQAEGFYEKEGLKVVEELMDARTTIVALVGGSVDVSWGDSTTFVLAVDRGAKIEGVGFGIDRLPYRFMAAPPYKRISDLKGKIVAASGPTEVYTTIIRQILKKGGLDPDTDVTIEYGGSSGQRVSGLLGGATQAALIPMPANLMFESKGFHTLAFTPDLYPSLLIALTLARTDWAEQHADAMRRYLRAQQDALDWLYNPKNKDQAIKILAASTKYSTDFATATYDWYVGQHAMPRSACPGVAGLRTLLSLMARSGQTQLTPADAGKLMDPRWCRA
jgi:ABC-type nitrate/sulfonate/bicarbonate transport system substrate-binding protein